LRPLQEKFEELENLLLHHRAGLAHGTGVPFVRLVHGADEEDECHRLRRRLERVLKREGIPAQTVSCRDVIFAPYERRGRLEPLFEQAQEERLLPRNIAGHARQELTQRLLAAARSLEQDGVIFLVDLAFLYPYVSLAPVLDDCTNRIVPPQALVVFYPGEVDVDGRLLFLGQRPAGYYRTRDLV